MYSPRSSSLQPSFGLPLHRALKVKKPLAFFKPLWAVQPKDWQLLSSQICFSFMSGDGGWDYTSSSLPMDLPLAQLFPASPSAI
jgi:hypothetical protein